MDETSATSSRPPTRSSRPLWLLLAGVLLAWVGLWAWQTAAAPEDRVPWRTDLEAAMQQARDEARPVLLNFTADWCPPCREMKAKVYSDPDFATWLESRVLPVKVDLTSPGVAEESWAMRYQVQYIPTQIVLSPEGEVLARSSGFIPVEAFRASLTKLLETSPTAVEPTSAGS